VRRLGKFFWVLFVDIVVAGMTVWGMGAFSYAVRPMLLSRILAIAFRLATACAFLFLAPHSTPRRSFGSSTIKTRKNQVLKNTYFCAVARVPEASAEALYNLGAYQYNEEPDGIIHDCSYLFFYSIFPLRLMCIII
jgi:hypothetical protein